MKMISYRTCIICKNKLEQSKLCRITRVNKHWYVNNDNKLAGRSIYLELNSEHLEKFKKIFPRFKIDKDNFEEIYKILKKSIDEG